MLVVSVSGDDITVERNIGGSTIDAVADDEELQIIGSAMEYGSKRRDVTSIQPVKDFNYVQTSREGWKVDGRLMAVSHYGEDPLTFARQDKERKFYREIERRYLLGKRAKSTISGVGTVTFSGGLKDFMDNETDCVQADQSGVTSWTRADVNAMLKNAFEIGSGHKIAICGYDILNVLGDFLWSKLEVVDMMQETLRVKVRRWECDYGTLDIMPHKLFTASAANGGLGLNGEMWIFDPENIERSGLPGRKDITLFTGPTGNQLQDPDEDAMAQELWVEDTIRVRHPETMYRAYGISA
jgi:hypothetical protein